MPATAAAQTEGSPRKREAGEPMYLDCISKQAALLQRHYRLSARETEVMELIARGNTVARIAEDPGVSENIIRVAAAPSARRAGSSPRPFPAPAQDPPGPRSMSRAMRQTAEPPIP